MTTADLKAALRESQQRPDVVGIPISGKGYPEDPKLFHLLLEEYEKQMLQRLFFPTHYQQVERFFDKKDTEREGSLQ